ncbi:hypothetical protein HAZT_HAZT009405 [Hyalella azteca]|uniref:G-patch domain-containing protein n=1 Tax=Hyalella azteca TaxID=294128 RepID=A0A6A0GND8_HYAAZ|nr:hypothetical protein HAZT_HAZT009405 [Hyalella azteca]
MWKFVSYIYRFHGAFTGGFSAGHFNTVGSVEGFTPSTFTSSRSERNKDKVAQNVEMFMDEEDMSAHGIAAQRLQPIADYAGGSSSDGKRKRIMPSTGPIPGIPVLLDITTDPCKSVGVRLLRSLGWREGQGVGPRLSHREKKRKGKKFSHSSAVDGPGNSDSDSELPAGYSNVTFAPEEAGSAQLAVLENKDNTFGLGYKPLSRDNILGRKVRESQPFSVSEKKKTMTIKGQAFGVGAFEEEDEDIYAQEDLSDYNFTLGGSATAVTKTSSTNSNISVRTGVKGAQPPVVRASTPPDERVSSPLPPELFSDEAQPSKAGAQYQPFSSDPQKQKRYELFLRMTEKGLKSRYNETQPASLTEWERDREIQEFERAALLYKPLTFAMATR